MRYSLIRNGSLVDFYDTKEEAEAEIKFSVVNRYPHLKPECLIKKADTYVDLYGTEKPCEIQIWRYSTLYFEQFLIIEGYL